MSERKRGKFCELAFLSRPVLDCPVALALGLGLPSCVIKWWRD
ncbi:hypothetical protein SLEP1_g11185 [Rubroshorea leprosula]|uniref:Uncharacterized protein n=1 Tax=Rubroshorea leprosula TaxID=152421 RepID=A0AAV5IIG4_9ROSI|nr:hypothetical protein SLEP1_g11185 [Rubroshorea leprosula]